MSWLLNRVLALGVGLAVTLAVLVLVGIYDQDRPKPVARAMPAGEVIIDLSPHRRP
jgi:hypothetical protein